MKQSIKQRYNFVIEKEHAIEKSKVYVSYMCKFSNSNTNSYCGNVQFC